MKDTPLVYFQSKAFDLECEKKPFFMGNFMCKKFHLFSIADTSAKFILEEEFLFYNGHFSNTK